MLDTAITELRSYSIGFAIAGFNYTKFSMQHLHQKIPPSRKRAPGTGFDPLRFLLHQIKHGIDFPLGGEHFAIVGDSFLFDNLFFLFLDS